ncbi:hypothetical protein CHLNCDRAFT_13300, partial [Chlorella variabilis]
IPALIRHLRSSCCEAVHEEAATALANLSAFSTDRSAAIAAKGAIPLLVQRLRSSGSESVQAAAAGALANMATCSSDRSAAIAAEGAIPLLVQRLRSGSNGVQEGVVRVLVGLSTDSPE